MSDSCPHCRADENARLARQTADIAREQRAASRVNALVRVVQKVVGGLIVKDTDSWRLSIESLKFPREFDDARPLFVVEPDAMPPPPHGKGIMFTRSRKTTLDPRNIVVTMSLSTFGALTAQMGAQRRAIQAAMTLRNERVAARICFTHQMAVKSCADCQNARQQPSPTPVDDGKFEGLGFGR